MNSKPSTPVKLVLLGEAAVGKSSLVLRFVSNDFQENKEPTIGAAYLTQRCTIDGRTIKFDIWDTAGQERFASLAPMYYRNASAALVVYDITKPQSFIKARHWVKELHEQASKNIIIALVGNKYDIVEESENNANGDDDAEAHADDGDENEENSNSKRKVNIEEGRQLAQDEGLLFFESSAKTGYNVNEIFMAIGHKIPDRSAENGNAAAGANGAAAGGNDRVDLSIRNDSASANSNNCAC